MEHKIAVLGKLGTALSSKPVVDIPFVSGCRQRSCRYKEGTEKQIPSRCEI